MWVVYFFGTSLYFFLPGGESSCAGHYHRTTASDGKLRVAAGMSYPEGMEPRQAIQEIREHANQIAGNVTAIHPLVPKLADPPTQAELFKALFELTKQVEIVKKHLLKLEKRDDSAAL
jgi:hypothetical protein